MKYMKNKSSVTPKTACQFFWKQESKERGVFLISNYVPLLSFNRLITAYIPHMHTRTHKKLGKYGKKRSTQEWYWFGSSQSFDVKQKMSQANITPCLLPQEYYCLLRDFWAFTSLCWEWYMELPSYIYIGLKRFFSTDPVVN